MAEPLHGPEEVTLLSVRGNKHPQMSSRNDGFMSQPHLLQVMEAGVVFFWSTLLPG